MKKFLSLLAIAIMALVLVGCKEKKGEVTLNSITITQEGATGTPKLVVGKQAKFKYAFDPADYKGTVVWSTSDETAMTVTQDGVVTPLKESKDGVYLYATCDNVRGQKKCRIQAAGGGGEENNYPDLQGYTIRIAQAEQALGNYDPQLPTYTQANKEAKLEAWDFIESNFNCHIEVVAYPGSAEWGPSRWNYILNQAASGVSVYDFLTVPDSKIPEFVEGNALIDTTTFYQLYGNNCMDKSFITSGSYKNKLYLLAEGENSIYNVMYYNGGLLEKLQKIDSSIKEPAQMFLDGEWTYSNFVDYCKKVQTAMGQLPAPSTEDAHYYAISGWNTYWFVGLAGTDGQPLADLTNWKINLDSAHKLQAIDTVKNLVASGVVDPKQNVDGAVVSWNEGRSLFNTGDLWFVNAADRWKENMWGDGGETKYCYVPWPMADDVTLDSYQIQLGGTAGWVMPIGRDYTGYGEECTAENIYRAVITLIQKTKEIYESNPDYDEATALRNVAAKYCATEASQNAYIKVTQMIKNGQSFYDPLSNNDNPIGSLYSSGETLRGAVDKYASAEPQVSSWAEAIASLVPTLEEAMKKAFS